MSILSKQSQQFANNGTKLWPQTNARTKINANTLIYKEGLKLAVQARILLIDNPETGDNLQPIALSDSFSGLKVIDRYAVWRHSPFEFAPQACLMQPDRRRRSPSRFPPLNPTDAENQ
jgi:hypothetical protein